MAKLVVKTVKLPKALAAALKRVAKQRSCSESELIREGIERVTSSEDDGIDMVAAIGDGFGIVRGPGDLSYNKKHMQGYGRSRNQ
ncbi:MAG TPA: CopG family transcriptional regulator [Kofleriaceae bacterium]